jgi:hypothetical protein
MRRLSPLAVLAALFATACANPREMRFSENNQDEVLARVASSTKISNEEKMLLQAYVGRAVAARAMQGMASILLGAGASKAPLPTPLVLTGKTVGEVIAEERRHQAAEKAAKEREARAQAEQRRIRDAYLPKMELRNLSFEKGGGSVFNREPVVFVKGEVRNTGDRTLTRVEVTAYLLDAADRPVGEDKCHPVLAGGFSDKGPLRPNYVAPLLCMFKSPPKEWAEKVDAKITDLTFEEPGSPR